MAVAAVALHICADNAGSVILPTVQAFDHAVGPHGVTAV